MKDYTMSEIKEICKKYEKCSECPFYRLPGGLSCTLTADSPERWDLSKVEPNTVDEREIIIKGFAEYLKSKIIGPNEKVNQIKTGFIDSNAEGWLKRTIDMTADEISLLLESGELVDFIKKLNEDNRNE